jgi:hypothetical protein
VKLAPEPSIFGPIISGADVEAWCIDLFRNWFGTYLSEIERQAGFEAGALQRPRSYTVAPSLDKWPEDQLPAVLVISVGTSEPPLREGGGSYRARFDVGAGCVCSSRTQAETRRAAMLYAAALRLLLIQRPSLDGHASGTVWTSESYDELDFDDGRTLGAGVVAFTVEVHEVALANAGPLERDLPLSPDTDPWPDDPIADDVEVAVESVVPPQTLPNEGGNE